MNSLPPFLAFPMLALAASAAGESAAPTSPPPPIGSAIFALEHLPAETIPVGFRRLAFDGPTSTLDQFHCHLTTLKAGLSPHPSHHHPDEEMLIVKEGVLDVTIAGQTSRAATGSIVIFAANVEHGLFNPGPESATYYVFRWLTPRTPPAQETKK